MGEISTTTADNTPTHISPITFDGIRVKKHHGAGKKRAAAANGAANTCSDRMKYNSMKPLVLRLVLYILVTGVLV